MTIDTWQEECRLLPRAMKQVLEIRMHKTIDATLNK